MRRMFSERQIKKWIVGISEEYVSKTLEDTISGKKIFNNDIHFPTWREQQEGLFHVSDKIWIGDTYYLQAENLISREHIPSEEYLYLHRDYTELDTHFHSTIKFPKINGDGAKEIATTDQFYAKADTYTKTECDNKFVTKSTGNPALSLVDSTKWETWTFNLLPIANGYYYLNLTIHNKSGQTLGAVDYPVLYISGNPIDCSLSTCCYEAPSTVIGAVIQTISGGTVKTLKLRTNGAVIPPNAYITISGVVQIV